MVTDAQAPDGGARAEPDADSSQIKQPLDLVVYEEVLACGDGNSNLATDRFDCDPSLIRCGIGDRGFLYYTVATSADGTSTTSDPSCLEPSEVEDAATPVTARPRITPALVLRAFERVPLPESELVVQPPGGQTLVGLDTIFSTKAEGFTETVTLLGRGVELDISPTSYRWSHGDSSEQTTDWPGQEWRRGGSASGYITHVYDDRMRVATSVDTTWSARYRIGGGAWQEVPGTVTIEGDPATLRVRSATPHLVGASDRG